MRSRGQLVALAPELPLVATRDIGTAAARLLLDRGWMPADPGVALCRSANDRLAAAVAASPAGYTSSRPCPGRTRPTPSPNWTGPSADSACAEC
ncbi:hypothetical protein ACWDQZ_00325 [Streptomyces tendae]|nr:hypothetical protein [Streptomyces sp. S10(2018)]